MLLSIDAGSVLAFNAAGGVRINGAVATWGANDSGGSGKRALVTDNI